MFGSVSVRVNDGGKAAVLRGGPGIRIFNNAFFEVLVAQDTALSEFGADLGLDATRHGGLPQSPPKRKRQKNFRIGTIRSVVFERERVRNRSLRLKFVVNAALRDTSSTAHSIVRSPPTFSRS
jgi:hypothetical protein